MVSAIVRVKSIAYEETLQNVFPMVKEKLLQMPSEHMLLRFFRELGDAALPVSLGVLSRLPEETKNALLVEGIRAFAPELTEKLNEELRNERRFGLGQCFQIGTISAMQQDDIFLEFREIRVDYTSLVKDDRVREEIRARRGALLGGIANIATRLTAPIAPGFLEEKGLALVNDKRMQEKTLQMVKKVLDENGVKVELESFHIYREQQSVDEETVDERHPFVLTKKMEDDILRALAGYLREKEIDYQRKR